MQRKKNDMSTCAICDQPIYRKHVWFHENLATDADHWPEPVIQQKIGVIKRLLLPLHHHNNIITQFFIRGVRGE